MKFISHLIAKTYLIPFDQSEIVIHHSLFSNLIELYEPDDWELEDFEPYQADFPLEQFWGHVSKDFGHCDLPKIGTVWQIESDDKNYSIIVQYRYEEEIIINQEDRKTLNQADFPKNVFWKEIDKIKSIAINT